MEKWLKIGQSGVVHASNKTWILNWMLSFAWHHVKNMKERCKNNISLVFLFLLDFKYFFQESLKVTSATKR